MKAELRCDTETFEKIMAILYEAEANGEIEVYHVRVTDEEDT